jgi:hypothetical protein
MSRVLREDRCRRSSGTGAGTSGSSGGGGSGDAGKQQQLLHQAGGKAATQQHGLILANGGVATYQHVLILSSGPRADGCSYPTHSPLPPDLSLSASAPEIAASPTGKAVIETYTVAFARDGRPERAFIVGRLLDGDGDGVESSQGDGFGRGGRRFVANEADEHTLNELCRVDREPVGRVGFVRAAGEKDRGGVVEGRNVFVFLRDGGAKL